VLVILRTRVEVEVWCLSSSRLAMVGDLAALVDEPDPRLARARAMSIFASMVGTLQISRALADDELAREVLAQGIENALALPDLDARRTATGRSKR